MLMFCVLCRGVNLVPFLEFIGLPDWMVGILRDSQGGYALTAYAMYKVYKQNLRLFDNDMDFNYVYDI